MVICDEYGIELTEDHLRDVRAISDENGEVRKNDFILHIKNTGMFGLFDKTDPESETHWQNVAITAFKLFDKNYDGYIDKKEFKWMTLLGLFILFLCSVSPRCFFILWLI